MACGQLTDLLGLNIKEVTKIEKKLVKLTKLVEENNNDTDEYEETLQTITKSISDLMKEHYISLTSIDYEKCQQFFSSISGKVDPLRQKLQTVIPTPQLYEFNNQLEILKLLCGTNFAETPLDFCRRCNTDMNRWHYYEKSIMNLIDEIHITDRLENILQKQYDFIQNPWKKIVLTVLGSLKSTKSSFVNFLLQEEICPTGNEAATARLTKITYGEYRKLTKMKSTGEVIETFSFTDTKELLSKATELIKLPSDQRSTGCNDEILIELPNQALKNVELWDIPGFDENETIDGRVKEIIDDADLIFALIPHQDSLKKSFQNFIEPRLNKHQNDFTDYLLNMSMGNNGRVAIICFIISQIDTFKINNQTNKSRDEVLTNLFTTLETQLNFKFDKPDIRSCNNFIPICTHPRFDIKTFLESRQMFINKSKQWFENAVRNLTYFRVKYLANVLEQILDYADASRTVKRCKELKHTMTQNHEKIESKLFDSVSTLLEPIKKYVQDNKEGILTECKLLIDQKESQKVEDEIKEKITHKFLEAINQNEASIRQQRLNLLQKHAYSLELDPAQMELYEQILAETDLNPYRLGIGFYENARTFGRIEDSVDPRLLKIMSLGASLFICGVLLVAINSVSDVVSMDGCLVEAGSQFITIPTFPPLEKIMRFLGVGVESRLEDALTQCINEVHQNLLEQITNAMLNFSKQHLKTVIIKIDEKISSLSIFSEQQIGILEKVIKEERLHVNELYLDLLSEQFKIIFLRYTIFKDRQLGRSNFRIFAAELHTQTSETIKAAAKQIPLGMFNVQEVRYMTLLHHSNIVRYYGIAKSRTTDSYYIIMDRMDCDSITYFKRNRNQIGDTQAIKMFSEITNALNYIHEQDLVHRDIKPANILVKTIDEEQPCFYLADFGIIHREPITSIGTPGYIAPECTENNLGPITHKSDVYSWGVTIQKIIDLLHSAQHSLQFAKWQTISNECIKWFPSQRPSVVQILHIINNETPVD